MGLNYNLTQQLDQATQGAGDLGTLRARVLGLWQRTWACRGPSLGLVVYTLPKDEGDKRA